jgi:hypothetical protein
LQRQHQKAAKIEVETKMIPDQPKEFLCSDCDIIMNDDEAWRLITLQRERA